MSSHEGLMGFQVGESSSHKRTTMFTSGKRWTGPLASSEAKAYRILVVSKPGRPEMKERFDKIDGRLDAVYTRLGSVEQRLSKVEGKLEDMPTKDWMNDKLLKYIGGLAVLLTIGLTVIGLLVS